MTENRQPPVVDFMPVPDITHDCPVCDHALDADDWHMPGMRPLAVLLRTVIKTSSQTSPRATPSTPRRFWTVTPAGRTNRQARATGSKSGSGNLTTSKPTHRLT